MKQTYSECVVRSGNINLYLSLRYQDLYNQIGKDFSGIAQWLERLGQNLKILVTDHFPYGTKTI